MAIPTYGAEGPAASVSKVETDSTTPPTPTKPVPHRPVMAPSGKMDAC